METVNRDEVKTMQTAYCAETCDGKFVRQIAYDQKVKDINDFIKTKASINLLTPITQQLGWNNRILISLLIAIVLGAATSWYKYSTLQTGLERQIAAVKLQTEVYQSGAKASLIAMKEQQTKTAGTVKEIALMLIQNNGGE